MSRSAGEELPTFKNILNPVFSSIHRRIALPIAKGGIVAATDPRILGGVVPAPIVHHLGVVVASSAALVPIVGIWAVVVQDAVGAEIGCLISVDNTVPRGCIRAKKAVGLLGNGHGVVSRSQIAPIGDS